MVVNLGCRQCGCECGTEEGLRDHLWQVHQVLRFPHLRPCYACGKVSDSQQDLLGHLHYDHVVDNKPSRPGYRKECKQCGFVTGSHRELVDHCWAVHEALYDPHTRGCQRCGRLYYDVKEFEQHLIDEHGATMSGSTVHIQDRCKQCGYRAPSYLDHKRHVWEIHGVIIEKVTVNDRSRDNASNLENTRRTLDEDADEHYVQMAERVDSYFRDFADLAWDPEGPAQDQKAGTDILVDF